MNQVTSTKPEIFSVWSDEIENRLDPLFYAGDILSFIRHSKFEIVELSSVITFIKTGFAAGKQNQSENKDGIVQIRPTNIDEFGNLKFDKIITLPSSLLDERAEDIIQKNEVLFNNTNSQELVGKSAYFDIDGTYFCSNHITRIKTDEKKLLPKFLWLLLNTYQVKKVFYKICVNWNNQSGVNVELLKTLQIPLPSLQKQREAIEFVHNAYHEKSKKEEEIKQILASIDDFVLGELGIEIPEGGAEQVYEIWSDEVIGGRLDPEYYNPRFKLFYAALSKAKYNIVNLEQITKTVFQGVGKNETENPAITLLKVKNITRNGDIDYSNIEFVQDVPEAKLLQKGDIVSPFIGEAVRQCKFAIFDRDDAAFAVDNNTGVIRVDSEKANSRYVAEVLNSSVGRIQLEQLIGGGGVPFLGAANAAKLQIPLPPIKTQERIADKIISFREQVRTLRAQATEVLESAQKQVEQMILA